MKDGKIQLTDINISITYHDSCYLGRYNDVYQAPRELLRAIPGARLFELERIKEKSFCCGAGGGRMWMEENLGTRINENRTKEILKTGANHVCTACPFCLTMLDDAIKAKAENVQVLDISEILLKVLNQNKDN